MDVRFLLLAFGALFGAHVARTHDTARYRAIGGVILGRGVGKSGTAVATVGSVWAGGAGGGRDAGASANLTLAGISGGRFLVLKGLSYSYLPELASS